jgi:hypothetical protein
MTTSTFNAIVYAKKLKDAGLPEKVADIQAEELSNIISHDLATKKDLLVNTDTIKNEIKVMEYQLKAFMIKSMISSITLIGGIQAILHLNG